MYFPKCKNVSDFIPMQVRNHANTACNMVWCYLWKFLSNFDSELEFINV